MPLFIKLCAPHYIMDVPSASAAKMLWSCWMLRALWLGMLEEDIVEIQRTITSMPPSVKLGTIILDIWTPGVGVGQAGHRAPRQATMSYFVIIPFLMQTILIGPCCTCSYFQIPSPDPRYQ